MHLKMCKTCNKEFTTNRSHKEFCSRLCYRRHPNIKAKYSARTNEYQKTHSRELVRRFQKLKFKCKHENRLLSISKEQFIHILDKPCSYCNKSLLNETGCSLDRIDNSKDYLINNVIPCCGTCNQIRNNHLTYDEMKVAMKAVIEFRKKMLGEL